MPAFTSEELCLISIFSYKSRNELINELSGLQGALSPEETLLSGLISGTILKLQKMNSEQYQAVVPALIEEKDPWHFDLGL